ncbi:MAG: four-carbon acid sugar kinase family protein [Ectothiorhodospiraceae bacterium]|nr:four-carbon acid sugar kinase family protein [Chromatiales bacterium]MCP5154430.1 four-carbon acid sugar kinase family protein [Ectothiorhodospiraceae bacterium]
MSILLGCIADDFTGATDLANTLVRRGMRTVQLIGVPTEADAPDDVDAVVVALKSRTIDPAEAVSQSLAALEWLRSNGARQYLFKYCSTFDSTPKGNIGPVAEALLDALGADLAIACPAFPETGRTIFKGHLFVGDVLLNECGMQNHPLTPMTDANLVRVLQAQSRSKVGLVQYSAVARGAGAVREALDQLRADGCRLAVVDALEDAHLEVIGEALADTALVTGGSGIALGLPANFRRAGLLTAQGAADALPAVGGRSAVLAGSCSRATLGQVEAMRAERPSFRVDPLAVAAGEDVAGEALAFATRELDAGPVLVFASADPETVRAAQDALGRERAGALVEGVMAKVAQGLVAAGVRKLVVAGGETAGAVVGALGVTGLRIGPQIDPGVPWTVSLGEPPIALALKSGNFGGRDFFAKSLGMVR